MLENYPNLRNIILGLTVLTIDLVVTYLIINRAISNREKKNWKPFRKHFFNSLNKSIAEFREYNLHMVEEIITMEEEVKKSSEYDILIKARLLKQKILDDYSWYQHHTSKVYNSIQTTGRGISHLASANFNNIFSYLDNSPSQISDLGFCAFEIEKELTMNLSDKEKINLAISKFSEKREETNRILQQSLGNYMQAVEDMIRLEKLTIRHGRLEYDK